VTHRQRPESAKGTVFLNLEDDTGMVNVICSPGAWERWRRAARGSPALLVRGRLERTDGVVSVVAEKISPLDLGPVTVPPARDFR
jgi:error-prone DNA polymerase